jgi:hypothetical protein
MSWCSKGEQISLERNWAGNPMPGRIYNNSVHPGHSARSLLLSNSQLEDPHKETVMVSKSKDARAIPAPRQVIRRQTHIRESWSPTERRERARQASAQMGLLWALINTPQRNRS